MTDQYVMPRIITYLHANPAIYTAADLARRFGCNQATGSKALALYIAKFPSNSARINKMTYAIGVADLLPKPANTDDAELWASYDKWSSEQIADGEKIAAMISDLLKMAYKAGADYGRTLR